MRGRARKTRTFQHEVAEAAKKHSRISILLIPKTPGDEFHPPQLAGSPIPTIGYKGMNSYALQFDGYEVPAENLLGAQTGKGFYQLMSTYEIARIQTGTATSSVFTVKPVSVFGPKVVVIATSAASRPRASKIRPIRGVLWRASKVNQRPSRKTSNQAL